MKNCEIIIIGVSAGGVEALNYLLPLLPTGFRIPIVVVLHVSPNSALISSAFQVPRGVAILEAEEKEKIEPAHIYFAPPNYHLLVESNRTFSLSVDKPVHFARPSIDVAFISVAEAYGPDALGIIMTGANEDGAEGLRQLKLHGGHTIVQNPASAKVSTMPLAAIAAQKPDHIFTLDQMANYLSQLSLHPFLGLSHAN